jgi:energy-coupling factor transport system ATP-binding protein
MIRFDRVSYAYPGSKTIPVIKELSLNIDSGEELAIMGGNGCGKTTLGLLLCGILKPDSGAVIVDGEKQDTSDHKTGIGFLFQDPDNGLVATTVEREVAFSLENRNTPTDQMRGIVDRILGLFEMERFRDRLVWNLSGGEKQRLSLAGLFAAEPQILFLDEPASFLDFRGSVQLDEAVREVKRIDPGISIIRITQYPSVADKYPRVIVMGDGMILGDDTPDNVFAERQVLAKSGIRSPYRFLRTKPEVGKIKTHPTKERSNTDTILEIDNITFGYDNSDATPIINGLSLTIRRGEVLGLVGASGSGKSTLAQIICGIYKPDSGDFNASAGSFRAVMSFQQPERQFFLDTCHDEVLYGIKNKYESNTLGSYEVRKSMEMAGLDYETFKDREPYTLSGGEARRLGFAVVIALDADIIIFDEPTCGLDEVGVEAFRRTVASLKAERKTVIIISHNSGIIACMSDSVAHLSEGKIISLMPPLEFFGSDRHKDILSTPEVIDYQKTNYGKVYTVHPGDIFELESFFA